MRWHWPLLAAAFVGGIVTTPTLAIPAFSGAEGWGAVTPGGRGGQVIHVTNLNDSGPGSYRAALTATGPRTVVFDVAGQVNLLSKVKVTSPFLTIAGQTAPGDGITISGDTTSLDASDIIIRHIRFRRGTTNNDHESALTHDGTTGNIIVDHVSASWGLDETLSLYRNKINPPYVPGGSTLFPSRYITIQWSIVSEALNTYNHAFGSTIGGVGANQHHNLWASNTGRNPSISYSHLLDIRNNVMFNWMHRSADGGGDEAHVNIINNYYKPGPATGFENTTAHDPIPQLKFRIVSPTVRHAEDIHPGGVGYWYVNGNYVEGYPAISADNWEGVQIVNGEPYHGVQFNTYFENSWARVNTPHSVIPPFDDPDDPNDDVNGVPIPILPLPKIATQSAQDAYNSVLAGAGASLVRDAVDLRVVQSVATGVATAGPRGDGIITDISQVGGFPAIPFIQRSPEFDTDGDGMPNEWEAEHDLNAMNAADRNADFDTDGYTNLEEFLDDIGAFKAVEDIVWEGTGRYALIDNWNLAFQPSRFDTAVINNGTATVDAIGQHAGTLKLGTQAGTQPTLNITSGRLEVAQQLFVGTTDGAAATLNLSGGELRAPVLAINNTSAFHFTGGRLEAGTVISHLANNGGTIAPGNGGIAPFGETTVTGNLALNSGALEIEIGGTAEDEFDRLQVYGQTSLGGTLRVRFVDLGEGVYAPQLGDAFPFLRAFGGASDMFDVFDLPELGAGLAWAIAPGDAALFLAVVSAPLAGDYNDDGRVDAADYTVWRDRLGSSGPLANETESLNFVDGADYAAWKANFGMARGGGAVSNVAVPEPASIALVLVGCVSSVIVKLRPIRRKE